MAHKITKTYKNELVVDLVEKQEDMVKVFKWAWQHNKDI